MSNEIIVTMVGRIATEFTRRRVGVDEETVVSFRVVNSERRLDRATGEWAGGERFSARVSCWGRLGEETMSTLMKGDPVVVRGRLYEREYEANGERRWSVEVRAHAVGPNLALCGAKVSRRRVAGDAAADDALAAGVGGHVALEGEPGMPAVIGFGGVTEDGVGVPVGAPDDGREDGHDDGHGDPFGELAATA